MSECGSLSMASRAAFLALFAVQRVCDLDALQIDVRFFSNAGNRCAGDFRAVPTLRAVDCQLNSAIASAHTGGLLMMKEPTVPQAQWLTTALRLCILAACSFGGNAQRIEHLSASDAGVPTVHSCAELQDTLSATVPQSKIVVAGTIECDAGIWGSKIYLDRPITLEGSGQAVIDWGDLVGGILLGQGAVIVFRNLILVQDAWKTGLEDFSVFDSGTDTGSTAIEMYGVAVLVRTCREGGVKIYEHMARTDGSSFKGRLYRLPYRGDPLVSVAVEAFESSVKRVGRGIVIRMCNTAVVCGIGARPVVRNFGVRSAGLTNDCHLSGLAHDTPKQIIKTAGISVLATVALAAAMVFAFGGIFFQRVARWALRGWACSGGCGGYQKGEVMVSDGNENLPSLCIELPSFTERAHEQHDLNGMELAEIQLGSPLGRGGFGKVYKGFFDNMIVAVKVIEHDGNLMRGEGEPLEALLSMHVDHPNVVKTFLKQTRGRGSFDNSVGAGTNCCTEECVEPKMNKQSSAASVKSEASDEVQDLDDFSYIEKNLQAVGHMDDRNNFRTWIVMEFCDRGSLATAVKTRAFFFDQDENKPNFTAMLLTALDIASAMDYLHSQTVIHGDLKAQNVLLKSSNTDRRGFYCKVGDFGLSRVTLNNTHIETFTCGTVRYMPPELLKDGLMTPAVDVYSYGMMMFELVSGQKPYPGKHHSDIIVSVVHGRRPVIPHHCPREFASLIQDCWHQDHTKRPPFRRILEQLRSIAKLYDSPSSRSLTGNRNKEENGFPDFQTGVKCTPTAAVKTHSAKSQGLCFPRVGVAGEHRIPQSLPGFNPSLHNFW